MSERLQNVENEENIYSENEIRIGTFLGKALYRKCWKTNVAAPADSSFADTGCSIDGYMVNMKALITYVPGSSIKRAVLSGIDNIFLNTSNKILIRQSMTNVDATVKAVIVEYTKEAW